MASGAVRRGVCSRRGRQGSRAMRSWTTRWRVQPCKRAPGSCGRGGAKLEARRRMDCKKTGCAAAACPEHQVRPFCVRSGTREPRRGARWPDALWPAGPGQRRQCGYPAADSSLQDWGNFRQSPSRSYCEPAYVSFRRQCGAGAGSARRLADGAWLRCRTCHRRHESKRRDTKGGGAGRPAVRPQVPGW